MQVCTQACGKTASIASGKPGEAVDAGDQDVVDAAAAQVVEHRQPELRALGVLPPDPERFAVAVAGDPDGEITGARADRAVLGDLHHQRVEVDDRIDRAPSGRDRQSAMSSSTASVTRLIVSRPTATP